MVAVLLSGSRLGVAERTVELANARDAAERAKQTEQQAEQTAA